MTRKLLGIAALLLFTTGIYAQTTFYTDKSWDEVKALAKKENKNIFVDCFTEWCGWCKVMDKQTFSDKEVGETMNSKFVNVKMDMERGFGLTMSMKYRIWGYPSFLIFNPDGKLIFTAVGYQEKDMFLKTLSEPHDLAIQGNYNGITDNLNPAFPDFYVQSFGLNGKRKFPDSLTVQNYLLKQKDLFTEVNWSVLCKYSHMSSTHQQFILNNYEKYASLYGRRELQDVAIGIIYSHLEKAIKTKNEAALEPEIFKLVDKYLPDNPEKTKASMRVSFYNETEMWDKLFPALDRFKSVNPDEANNMVNECAWNIYEKTDDKMAIAMAAKYMKDVIEKDPQYAYVDTFAALLFKDGAYNEAEQFANIAIEAGKQNGENVKGTEELLVKIKAAKAGK